MKKLTLFNNQTPQRWSRSRKWKQLFHQLIEEIRSHISLTNENDAINETTISNASKRQKIDHYRDLKCYIEAKRGEEDFSRQKPHCRCLKNKTAVGPRMNYVSYRWKGWWALANFMAHSLWSLEINFTFSRPICNVRN